ncbi:MAG: response regulator [Candidatus Thermoplasmatota archaeon]|nr:response regulator [Candidatus Thermoplasmatota archaeon]
MMSIKTLLIDDERSLLEQAEKFIQKMDPEIEVFTAISAEKGLKVIDEKTIDVIVSDYQMPKTDGIELLKKVREDYGDIPFIILTGRGREEVVMEALNHGADGYLKKEGDTDALWDLVTRAIHREYDRWKTEKEFEENKKKIEDLHQVASNLISCDDEKEAYSLTMEAAEKILNYDYCGIAEVINGIFKRRATSSNLKSEDIVERSVEDGGIDKETWINKEKFLIDDVDEDSRANPVINNRDFRSLISLPVDDIGIFQAISNEPGFFNENDLQMSELLVSHLANAIKRIRSKKELERKEKLYRKIFETTGSAMALIDEDMKISLANDKFHRLLGYYDESMEGLDFLKLMVEEDVQRVERHCEETKEDPEGMPTQFNMQIKTQTDEVLNVLVTLGYTDEVNRFVFSLLEIH